MYYAAESLAESTARDTLEARALLLHAFQRKYSRSGGAAGARGAAQSRAAGDGAPAPPSALQLQLARLLREGAAAQAAPAAGGGAASHAAIGGGGGGGSSDTFSSGGFNDVQRAAMIVRLKMLVHAKYCGAAPGVSCAEFPECAIYKTLWPHLAGVRRRFCSRVTFLSSRI